MNRSRTIARMAIFLCLLIISAYIQITLPTPFFVMHLTLQLFVSLVAGMVLPAKESLSVMAIYLLVGLLGLPVFATGGGPAYLLKPTSGFLIGFLLCTAACGIYKEKAGPQHIAHGAWCGLALYYLCGNLYYIFATRVLLQTPVPLLIGFINCFVVSIIPDVLLTILAISCAKRLSPIIH